VNGDGRVADVLRRPLVRLAVILALVALFFWAVYALRDVLTPFAVAFGLAYFLNPVVNGLERAFARAGLGGVTGIRARIAPRTAAVGVLVVGLLVVLAVAVMLVVPGLVRQATELAANLPGYLQSLRDRGGPLYADLEARYPQQVEAARQRLTEAARTALPSMLAPVWRAVGAAFSSVMGFVLALLDLVIIPVFAVYLLFDMNRIKAGAAALVPHRLRPYVYSRLQKVDRLLAAFVRGQVTVALLLGVFYAVALTFCGVPMGLLVGFVIGLFNLIPFMSTVLGLPLALVLSWVDDRSLPTLAVVFAVFAFGQFVEGNFISPRIVGQSVGLHAVVIMLAVLVGGKLFGLVGMFIAVPLTASLSVFWTDLRDWYMASDFYRRAERRGEVTPV
jgi:predicted PurR-regulated permease PerM